MFRSHRGGMLAALIVLALLTVAACGSENGSQGNQSGAKILRARTAPLSLPKAQPWRRRPKMENRRIEERRMEGRRAA
jgi:hypothetical protein